jgi:FMN phosphatase YigB (HAD superfamily)
MEEEEEEDYEDTLDEEDEEMEDFKKKKKKNRSMIENDNFNFEKLSNSIDLSSISTRILSAFIEENPQTVKLKDNFYTFHLQKTSVTPYDYSKNSLSNYNENLYFELNNNEILNRSDANYESNYDENDEVLNEIKRLQNKLKEQVIVNNERKSNLLKNIKENYLESEIKNFNKLNEICELDKKYKDYEENLK